MPMALTVIVAAPLQSCPVQDVLALLQQSVPGRLGIAQGMVRE
jgi:hypothetical protein